MKHILTSCDCCEKTVPTDRPKGWWGVNKPTAAVPQFTFAPLSKHDALEYPRHLCSLECLQKVLQACAEAVDMKAVAKAKPVLPSYSPFASMLFGPSTSDLHDSTNTYKQAKEDAEEDNDESSE